MTEYGQRNARCKGNPEKSEASKNHFSQRLRMAILPEIPPTVTASPGLVLREVSATVADNCCRRQGDNTLLPQEMTIRTLHKTTRPVSFENDDPDFPYSDHGSCVVLGYRGRTYAVSALHVPDGRHPREILVPYEEGSHKFLPVKEAFTIQTDEDDDSDHKDVILLEIWHEKLDLEAWNPDLCFSLDSNHLFYEDSPPRITISGYPNELREVDYDEQCIRYQACHISGSIAKRDYSLGIDQIAFDNEGGLKEFKGMSGGGVFSFRDVAPGQTAPRFEGILLRGTPESLLGYILRTDYIRSYIDRQQCETVSRD
jgi:hypothetical protein